MAETGNQHLPHTTVAEVGLLLGSVDNRPEGILLRACHDSPAQRNRRVQPPIDEMEAVKSTVNTASGSKSHERSLLFLGSPQTWVHVAIRKH